LTPHFTISVWEAIGRRLRRNYVWIFALLALSWNLKVYLYPVPAKSFDEFILRAQVGLVPGWIVFAVGFVFNAAVFMLAVATVKLREATGEVLPRHEFSLRPLARVSSWTRAAGAAATSVPRATLRRAKRARQRLRGTSGEFKKIDITQTPDRRIHISETPDRPRSKQ
jgi:xanthine/uracil permease